MNRIKSTLSSFKSWPSSLRTVVPEPDLELAVPGGTKSTLSRIEDYPLGYPQYSALISSHDFFFAFRSFRRLRARLLLKKQDEINILEEQLDALDRDERLPFFLATYRNDKNTTRTDILTEIDSKLAEYDALVERSRHMMSLNRANLKNVESLQNWIDSTGCLVEEETLYLEKENDLITLATSTDPAMKRLEDWVESCLIRYYKGFREGPGFEVSSNSSVYIYSGTLIKTIATVLMLLLIILILLMPIVICIFVEGVSARIFIIILSTASFLTVLSRLTRCRMIELILAGATFATVLNVFVSNS